MTKKSGQYILIPFLKVQ